MAEELESSESDLYCVIFKVEFPDKKSATTVTKGLPNLEEFAKLQNRDDVVQHITTQRNKEPEGNIYIHPECTKVFVNLKRIRRTGPAPQSTPKKKKLCSCKERFSWQTNCFYCDTPVIFDDRHEDRHHSSRRVQCRRTYIQSPKEMQ